jgi:hypothetical protein
MYFVLLGSVCLVFHAVLLSCYSFGMLSEVANVFLAAWLCLPGFSFFQLCFGFVSPQCSMHLVIIYAGMRVGLWLCCYVSADLRFLLNGLAPEC